jgi:hypothetical protein
MPGRSINVRSASNRPSGRANLTDCFSLRCRRAAANGDTGLNHAAGDACTTLLRWLFPVGMLSRSRLMVVQGWSLP